MNRLHQYFVPDTVYSGLLFADRKPLECVTVVGIATLSHLVIQNSKAAGYETITVTNSKDKEELAYKLGAHSFVAYGNGLSEDQGCGAVVILVASNSYKAVVDSIKGLRPDGRLILVVASVTNEPPTLSPELHMDFLS